MTTKELDLSKKIEIRNLNVDPKRRKPLTTAEVWHNGAFIKRWKYWECVLDIAADYMLKEHLL